MFGVCVVHMCVCMCMCIHVTGGWGLGLFPRARPSRPRRPIPQNTHTHPNRPHAHTTNNNNNQDKTRTSPLTPSYATTTGCLRSFSFTSLGGLTSCTEAAYAPRARLALRSASEEKRRMVVGGLEGLCVACVWRVCGWLGGVCVFVFVWGGMQCGGHHRPVRSCCIFYSPINQRGGPFPFGPRRKNERPIDSTPHTVLCWCVCVCLCVGGPDRSIDQCGDRSRSID